MGGTVLLVDDPLSHATAHPLAAAAMGGWNCTILETDCPSSVKVHDDCSLLLAHPGSGSSQLVAVAAPTGSRHAFRCGSSRDLFDLSVGAILVGVACVCGSGLGVVRRAPSG